MGRTTKITKECILETAYRMLLQDGYAAINVKTLAAAIGCSTQPIVWHFENMSGFRRAFLDYCIVRAKEQFTVREGNLEEMLAQTASRYVSIAVNTPHLFRFVFGEHQNAGELVKALQPDSIGRFKELLCREKGLTQQQAASFLMNYECYLHGIASYTASGFCNYSDEEILFMVSRAAEAFLQCASGEAEGE